MAIERGLPILTLRPDLCVTQRKDLLPMLLDRGQGGAALAFGLCLRFRLLFTSSRFGLRMLLRGR